MEREPNERIKKRIILGSPKYYKVDKENNEYQLDKNKTEEQFLRLKDHIERHNYEVKVVPGHKDLYDSVYITNSALVINDFAIMARYSKPSRRGEEELLANYLKKELGYRIIYLPKEDGLYFEGQGDCRFSHNNTHLWMAYGAGRTTMKGINAVKKILKEELKDKAPVIHPLRICDRKTFHLDLCLLPLPNNSAIYHSTFSQASEKELRKIFGEKMIKAPTKFFYTCNSVVLDDKTLLTPRLGNDFRSWIYNASKLKVDDVNVSQFQEGNGSVQCMVLNFFII
jgi:N-dimethylarginine dimethylaminohydrolase